MVSMTLIPIVSALDGDGDGINDSNDVCPFAAGTANSTAGFGCPDSNGDGLADFEQPTRHAWSESASVRVTTGTTSGEVNVIEWAINGSVFLLEAIITELLCMINLESSSKSIHNARGYNGHRNITKWDNLVIGSKNGGCIVINATTGTFVADLWNGTTSSDIYEVGWSRDDERIFCGGFDST